MKRKSQTLTAESIIEAIESLPNRERARVEEWMSSKAMRSARLRSFSVEFEDGTPTFRIGADAHAIRSVRELASALKCTAALLEETSKRSKRFEENLVFTISMQRLAGHAGAKNKDVESVIAQCVKENLDHQTIANKLRAEGYKNSRGGNWNRRAVTQYIYRMRMRNTALR